MPSLKLLRTALALSLLWGGAMAQEALRSVPYKPDPPFAIDGGLGDWQAVPGPWSDTTAGVVRLAWRAEALFLAVESTDADPRFLALTVQPGPGLPRRSLLFAMDGRQPVISSLPPDTLDIGGVRTEAGVAGPGLLLEASIPWDVLGLDTVREGQVVLLDAGLSGHLDGGQPMLAPALLVGADGTLRDAPPIVEFFGEERLAPGAQKTFAFEAHLPPKGLQAVLSLQARQEFDQVAGHAPVLRVSLNGTPAGGERMRNRPMRLRARGGSVYSMAAGDVLAVYYSPDFTSPDTHPHYGPVDPVRVCLIELDVTDLLAAGNNNLLIEHTAPSNPCPLVLADGALRFLPPPPPVREKAGPPEGPLPRMMPVPVPASSFDVLTPDDHIVEVHVAGDMFRVESRFSTPAPAWVTGENAWFQRERTVETTPEAVIVRDVFTNLTDAPLPLMRRNDIRLEDRLARLWLAGLERMDKTGHSASPANPTTFAATDRAGIGLLPLDDISRVHVANHAENGIIALSDNNLVLSPGATYTAEWAIIPTDKPDYWTFINAARRLCDANFTVDGAFAFFRADPRTDVWSDGEIADFLRFKSAKYVCASINYPLHQGRYPHGTAFQHITHDNYRNSFDRWKGLVPSIQTLVYFHCFIDVMDDSPERYADARLLLPDGSQAIYGKDHDRIFVPTAENEYGRAVARNVDIILDDIGADGVYWDEHQYSRFHYHYGGPWDGYSGDIDSRTMQVSRFKSSVTLLSESWRLTLAQDILARGPLIGNGPPFTRAMAALKFPCFVETGSITHCVQAHLYSPIALGDHLTERSERDAYQTMLAALDYGCVYHWYNDLSVVPTHFHLVEYMYPITPIEIHGGYILAEERIITRTSGVFGWNDAAGHEVHVFDDTGREVEGFNAPQLTDEGKTWTELRLAEDWSAVIVRK